MGTLQRLVSLAACSILLAGCAARVADAPPAPSPQAGAALQGTWVVEAAELGGHALPIPASYRLVVAGHRYGFGEGGRGDHGTLVFLGGNPAAMDIVGEEGPNKGKRFQAIYRAIEGGRLEVTYDIGQRARPGAFASRPGTQELRVIYQRVS